MRHTCQGFNFSKWGPNKNDNQYLKSLVGFGESNSAVSVLKSAANVSMPS